MRPIQVMLLLQEQPFQRARTRSLRSRMGSDQIERFGHSRQNHERFMYTIPGLYPYSRSFPVNTLKRYLSPVFYCARSLPFKRKKLELISGGRPPWLRLPNRWWRSESMLDEKKDGSTAEKPYDILCLSNPFNEKESHHA